MDIIEKLKQADLKGRGGAGFPTWQKWQMVKDAPAAEGEAQRQPSVRGGPGCPLGNAGTPHIR